MARRDTTTIPAARAADCGGTLRNEVCGVKGDEHVNSPVLLHNESASADETRGRRWCHHRT